MYNANTSNGVSPSPSRFIDLRSDTVTKPTEAMREAMKNAQVGDDVFGDDPTIHELQEEGAKLLKKEAALFVSSGTMANLIAVMAHVDARGGEMIVGDLSHIHSYEQGGSAFLGGVHSTVLPTQPDGTIALDAIKRAIRPVNDYDHSPLTQLICIENTHNKCGGRVLSPAYTQAVADLAHQHKLKLHIDGARLLNAAIALNVPPHTLVEGADSISVCLSKGLGAPVGSLLIGSAAFIRTARRLRKALGGGTRQAGVLAAAGLISLRDMPAGLKKDHEHAKELARELAKVEGLKIDVEGVESNIVFISLEGASQSAAAGLSKFDAAALQEELKRDHGILIGGADQFKVRLVTHHQISSEDVQTAIKAISQVVQKHTVKA